MHCFGCAVALVWTTQAVGLQWIWEVLETCLDGKATWCLHQACTPSRRTTCRAWLSVG